MDNNGGHIGFELYMVDTPGRGDRSSITAPSEQGLFNRYFREMIRERYDVAAKIVEMNVLLNAVDIANFSFADTIIIKVNGTPVGLRIVDIIDYSPNTTRLTKVKAYITFIK
jgi:hypothetical protein